MRIIFGEPPRTDRGPLLDAITAIERYETLLDQGMEQNVKLCRDYNRLKLWTRAFIGALDELEQSQYCSVKFREQVRKKVMQKMDSEEITNYNRHVYFYKNAFIRVFSILDKLGYFLNDCYGLGTERVKHRFSYFTVLRQMRETGNELKLSVQLNELKMKHQQALDRLRKKRNMEIHSMNAELIDDLALSKVCAWDRTYVEDLDENLSDLQAGFEMVCGTLRIVFSHMAKRLR